jgi:hypothetical protein
MQKENFVSITERICGKYDAYIKMGYEIEKMIRNKLKLFCSRGICGILLNLFLKEKRLTGQ